jgi:uncharacterized cupredoxin-like copper-binding protein
MMKHRFAFGGLFALLLVVLSACGASSAASPASGSTGVQNVQVTLSEFKINSSLTTFSSGVPYHFVVANAGKIVHEFMIMPMGMTMTMGTSTPSMNMGTPTPSMENMDKQALAMIQAVNPGETRTLDYTFAQDTSGQHLEFDCHLPGHYEAGMKLAITVNK